jgi:hypothetical protein
MGRQASVADGGRSCRGWGLGSEKASSNGQANGETDGERGRSSGPLIALDSPHLGAGFCPKPLCDGQPS